MTQKYLIVAVFDTVDVARGALHDFQAIAEKDEGFQIENGLLAQKGADGQLSVVTTVKESIGSSVVGALTGGLMDLLGGSSNDVTDATYPELLDNAFVTSIAGEFTPGSAATILEAKEQTTFAVDNVVNGLKGKVFRKVLA